MKIKSLLWPFSRTQRAPIRVAPDLVEALKAQPKPRKPLETNLSPHLLRLRRKFVKAEEPAQEADESARRFEKAIAQAKDAKRQVIEPDDGQAPLVVEATGAELKRAEPVGKEGKSFGRLPPIRPLRVAKYQPQRAGQAQGDTKKTEKQRF